VRILKVTKFLRVFRFDASTKRTKRSCGVETRIRTSFATTYILQNIATLVLGVRIRCTRIRAPQAQARFELQQFVICGHRRLCVIGNIHLPPHRLRLGSFAKAFGGQRAGELEYGSGPLWHRHLGRILCSILLCHCHPHVSFV